MLLMYFDFGCIIAENVWTQSGCNGWRQFRGTCSNGDRFSWQQIVRYTSLLDSAQLGLDIWNKILMWLKICFTVTSLPSSSYRLGVRAANLHELFPSHITSSLQHSLLKFDKEVSFSCLEQLISRIYNVRLWKLTPHLLILELQLPGFISSNALLHGVEVMHAFLREIIKHRIQFYIRIFGLSIRVNNIHIFLVLEPKL